MKKILAIVLVVVVAFLAYRLVFVRTVNYEIGGIKIPSKYNVLTGKVTPIIDYKGKAPGRTVADTSMKKTGLSRDEVTLAQFRWTVFEHWVKARPQFNGWDSDTAIFKKANDAFRKELEASGTKIRLIR